jgi:hypothetical protein
MAQYNNEGKRVFPNFAEEVERKIKEMTFPKVMAVFGK